MLFARLVLLLEEMAARIFAPVGIGLPAGVVFIVPEAGDLMDDRALAAVSDLLVVVRLVPGVDGPIDGVVAAFDLLLIFLG